MAPAILSVAWLRAKLTAPPFNCEAVAPIRGDELEDPIFPGTFEGEFHQFKRFDGVRELTSEIHCHHEGLPNPPEVVQVFLRKLGIDLEELSRD